MPALMIMASAAALLHSTMVTSGPLIPDGATPGPMPQNGVWALLPDKCDQPTSLDMSTWPKCATPVGFLDDEVAALEKPGPGKKATPDEFYSMARTKYAIAGPGTVTASAATADPAKAATPATSAPAPVAPVAAVPPAATGPTPAGAPVLVAQVVVPMVFSRSYYYISLTPKALDDAGRFAEARGWPVACAAKDQGGCNPTTLTAVQTQAAVEPNDPQRLYRLVRILPTAAADSSAAPLTTPPASTTTVPPADPISETPLPPAKTPPADTPPAPQP